MQKLIALETLAVKAFGYMGHMARLRIIRDRFIAGRASCELRRHLDSVALLSGTFWIVAGYGRVTLIRTIGVAVDRDPRGPYRSIWWITRAVGEMTGPWRLLPLRRQRRSSWSRCSGMYVGQHLICA